MWTKLTHSRLFQIFGMLLFFMMTVILVRLFMTTEVAATDPATTASVVGLDFTPTSMTIESSQMMVTPYSTEYPATITNSPPTGGICAEAWDIEISEPLPEWLQTPASAEGLHTEVKFYLLAGQLISRQIVDATSCIDGGLTTDGTANTCGMEKAYDQVIAWQNQFDAAIYQAALDNLTPAQLIKRLFAQETQFWPPDKLAPASYGIGSVTSPGVEPLFLWYEDIYQEACRGLSATDCSQPYHSLPLKDQQALRGYLISQYMHVYCPSCPYGIDLDKISRSIDYFAKLIVANCHQTGLVLRNHGFSPSAVAYDDAWRLTLANYSKGASCISNAVDAMEVSAGFTWEGFTKQLSPGCYVDIYINRITGE